MIRRVESYTLKLYDDNVMLVPLESVMYIKLIWNIFFLLVFLKHFHIC